jgi:hypothetical protein
MAPLRAEVKSGVTVILVVLLLAGGVLVYAAPPAASPLDDNLPASTLTFGLAPVAAPSAQTNPGATGKASLYVQGQTLGIEWAAYNLSPGIPVELAMVVNSSGHSATQVLSTVVTSSEGNAGSTASTTLGPGSYAVGLRVYETESSAAGVLLLSSMPAFASLTIGSSSYTEQYTSTEDHTGGTGSYGFTLVPMPTLIHQSTPQDYPFKEGGAVIQVYGDVMAVSLSFLGTPNTQFKLVLSRGDSNETLGTITTGGSGGGVLKTTQTLSPGVYSLGLLIFAGGDNGALVAQSVPRSVSIVIASNAGTVTQSTTTTTTSTEQNYHPESGSGLFELAPVTSTSAPSGYLYGTGKVEYATTGAQLLFSGVFAGQNPNTHYLFAITVNGSAKQVGDYTTDQYGTGHLGASVTLGQGTFAIGVEVLDASTFSTPTVVLAGNPTSILFHFNLHGETETSSTFSHTVSSSTGNENEYQNGIRLVPAPFPNAPGNYRFGAGTAIVYAQHGYLALEVGITRANPSTGYEVALSLNGTQTNIGTMTTNGDGSAYFKNAIQVNPGTYVLRIVLYDATSFKESSPVLVLQNDPSAHIVIVVPASSTTEISTGPPIASSTVKTINGGGELETQIQKDVGNLTIPAVVQVTALSSSTQVFDPRFSVSVGTQTSTGLVIAISGSNVTGGRVLLLNLSKTSPLTLFPALNVTLDGSPVAEASSATQVLSPSPGAPATYVLVSTSAGVQLLISIPHFSVHIIQVAGASVQTLESILELNAPLLAASILVVTLLFGGLYAARRRLYSLFV